MFVKQNFDINAYLGEWQEISSIPQVWEKYYAGNNKSCGGASAQYSLSSDKSRIYIRNICYDINGNVTGYINGSGIFAKSPTTGWLYIMFNTNMPKFIIHTIGADYIIHDTDYINYSMVGTTSKKALWILARPHTKMTEQIYKKLLNTAKYLGYPVEMLELTKVRISFT
jgi:lipocalin